MTNWKAAQAHKGEYQGVLPRYMTMGSWKADASQNGRYHVKSSGGPDKRKKK